MECQIINVDGAKPADWWRENWKSLVVTPGQARNGARPFHDPRGVACGVYLALHETVDQVLYVGSSVQLSNRLRNSSHIHHNQPTFSFEVPAIFLRDVEASYFFALNPRLNAKSPPGNSDAKLTREIRRAWAF